jgi:hypothetical protein
MTTTLDLIHRELDDSLERQIFLIEFDAETANESLDDMVDDFNREQLKKPRTIAQIEQRDAWRATLSGYAEVYLRESKTLGRMLRTNEPGSIANVKPGFVTFPLVSSRTRTYDEQRRLRDRREARKNPDGIAFPGPPSHHISGLAIDTDETFWRAQLRRLSEPWHFEYPALKRKPWWRRALNRAGNWWHSTAFGIWVDERRYWRNVGYHR